MRLRSSAGSRQATLWPSSPGTGSSRGSILRCSSLTYGQRGWKWQPDGRLIRLGGRPEIGTSSSPRGLSRRGIDLSSPQVYGCWGEPKIASVGARSTIRPAYMTAISSVISATTPRSWVMMMIAIPSRDWRSSRRARICAWTVTSSAVVGSSAISSSGLVGERHRDHHTLAHAARELVRELVDPPRRVGNPDELEQLHRAGARCRLRDVSMRVHRLGQLLADLVERMQRRQRVLEDHRDVVAADLAKLGVRERHQIAALEQDPPLDVRPLVSGEPERRSSTTRSSRSPTHRRSRASSRLRRCTRCRRPHARPHPRSRTGP